MCIRDSTHTHTHHRREHVFVPLISHCFSGEADHEGERHLDDSSAIKRVSSSSPHPLQVNFLVVFSDHAVCSYMTWLGMSVLQLAKEPKTQEEVISGYIRTCTHARTHASTHTHAHTHAHTRTHTHTHTREPTNTQLHTQTHTHTHTQTRARTHSCTHTHTHTHLTLSLIHI